MQWLGKLRPLFIFVYVCRERERERGTGRGREGETERCLQTVRISSESILQTWLDSGTSLVLSIENLACDHLSISMRVLAPMA